MAKIIKTDMQETALKVIKGNLKILMGINAVFNSKAEKSRIIIAAGNKKVSLMIEQPLKDNILKEIRKRIILQTEALAKRNAIELDDEDIAALENRDGECRDRGLLESKERSVGIDAVEGEKVNESVPELLR